MDVIYKILLLIDSVIYGLVKYVYQIFFLVSKGEIFSNAVLQSLYDRVNVIIGVVMLFIVSFSLLQAMANPDNITKGENSTVKLIPNIIITIILLVMVPYAFRVAYKVQGVIISSNFVGRLITGSSATKSDDSVAQAGLNTAVDVFAAFFIEKDDNRTTNYEGDYNKCSNSAGLSTNFTKPSQLAEFAKKNGDFCAFRQASKELASDETTLDYQVIVSTLAGAFVFYIFLSFCLDMGIRCAKLAFYQLIAPIPILARIIPKQKKIFEKWLSVTISTFLEVFLKIAIIFFAIFLITKLDEVWDTFWNTTAGSSNIIVNGLAKVIIILGLLMFAKQAPKLIGDLFGVELKGGLGIKKKLSENLPDFAKGMASGGASGIGAAARNIVNAKKSGKSTGAAIRSGLGGLAGGAKRGYQAGKSSKDWKEFKAGVNKGADDAVIARDKRKSRIEAAGGSLDNMKNQLSNKASNVKDFFAGGSASEMAARAQEERKALEAMDQVKHVLEANPLYVKAKAEIDNEKESALNVANLMRQEAVKKVDPTDTEAMNGVQATYNEMYKNIVKAHSDSMDALDKRAIKEMTSPTPTAESEKDKLEFGGFSEAMQAAFKNAAPAIAASLSSVQANGIDTKKMEELIEKASSGKQIDDDTAAIFKSIRKELNRSATAHEQMAAMEKKKKDEQNNK